MDFETFIPNVLRTEATLPADKTIQKQRLTMAFILAARAAEVLNLFKRELVYNKELETDLLDTYLQEIESFGDMIRSLKNETPVSLSEIGVDPRKIHALIGMTTEGGEIGKEAAQWLDTGFLSDLNVGAEMGDFNYYQGLWCHAAGIQQGSILDLVVSKLNLKFPEGYDENLADNRDITLDANILK